jgi:hypothetical protein
LEGRLGYVAISNGLPSLKAEQVGYLSDVNLMNWGIPAWAWLLVVGKDFPYSKVSYK